MMATMEGLTLIWAKDRYEIAISEKEVDEDKIQTLFHHVEDFWNVKDLKSEKGMLHILYEKPDRARSFYSVMGASEILKLSLLIALLIKNPLEQGLQKTYVHPMNLFFTDMKTVSLMYRDPGCLKHDGILPTLEQYKILCLSMLIGKKPYTYERLRDNRRRKKILEKMENSVFNTIERMNTREELVFFLQERLNRLESEFFLYEEQQQKLFRRKKLRNHLIMTVAVVGTCCLICAVIIGALVL